MFKLTHSILNTCNAIFFRIKFKRIIEHFFMEKNIR